MSAEGERLVGADADGLTMRNVQVSGRHVSDLGVSTQRSPVYRNAVHESGVFGQDDHARRHITQTKARHYYRKCLAHKWVE